MKYLEIEDLARLSTDIIHGQVLSTRTYWDDTHTRILTAVRVQVNECFKGASKRGAVVTITQWGGELDGIRMDFSGRPTFQVGETTVLFTRANPHNDLLVVGLKQGKLIVQGNEAKRELSGVSFVDAAVANNQTAAAAQPRKTVQMRYTLDELRERIMRLR